MNKALKEWMRVIAEASAIVILLYALLWPVHIDGISMQNTLMHNDMVVISRLLSKISSYNKGDLVVFNWYDGGKKIDVVKRIIAVEEDFVDIKNGNVWVNNNLLEEGYTIGETLGSYSFKVPKDHVFVMGDNRQHSQDSRVMGAIPIKTIEGRVLFRWYPFSNINLF